MSREADEARQNLAASMLDLSAAIEPMHDFLAGQVAYFAGQGFRPEEALAMAAAEFCTIFGGMITRNLPEGWGQ